MLEKHELSVNGFEYRTNVSVGKMKADSIMRSAELLKDMIKMPNCTQKCLSAALMEIAKANEKEWKLSSLKRSWSVKNAKMLRAMVRDIKGAIYRRSKRGGHVEDWLQTFMLDAGTGAAPSQEAPASAPAVWKYGWDDEEQAN